LESISSCIELIPQLYIIPLIMVINIFLLSIFLRLINYNLSNIIVETLYQEEDEKEKFKQKVLNLKNFLFILTFSLLGIGMHCAYKNIDIYISFPVILTTSLIIIIKVSSIINRTFYKSEIDEKETLLGETAIIIKGKAAYNKYAEAKIKGSKVIEYIKISSEDKNLSFRKGSEMLITNELKNGKYKGISKN